MRRWIFQAIAAKGLSPSLPNVKEVLKIPLTGALPKG
jgi:hypothetical protein